MVVYSQVCAVKWMKHYLYFLLAGVVGVLPYAVGHSLDISSEGSYKCMQQDIPEVVDLAAVSVTRLNLDAQGNVIIARPGERIYTTINYACDEQCIDPYSLNQIIIGYEDLGPQDCILNELGYRCHSGIVGFVLRVPKSAGTYNVQCCFVQAYSPAEAMKCWENAEVVKKTVGQIIVSP